MGLKGPGRQAASSSWTRQIIFSLQHQIKGEKETGVSRAGPRERKWDRIEYEDRRLTVARNQKKAQLRLLILYQLWGLSRDAVIGCVQAHVPSTPRCKWPCCTRSMLTCLCGCTLFGFFCLLLKAMGKKNAKKRRHLITSKTLRPTLKCAAVTSSMLAH